MNSSRPYLLRAIHQWIVDNDCTPHMLVNAAAPGVQVPLDHVDNDKIVLNIGPTATQRLELGDDAVTFDARFQGHPMTVIAPVAAILAVYARENGQGMLFTEDDGSDAESPATGDRDGADDHQTPASARRPNLRVIK